MKEIMKWTGIVAMLVITLVAAASAALAMPVSIDYVKVNGDAMDANTINRVVAERGDKLEIAVRVTAESNAKDVEIEAAISGYEYNDEPENRIWDSTEVFDASAQASYVKKLYITLPDDIEQDDYRLRITVSDRNNEGNSTSYRFKIEGSRHDLQITDVVLSANTVSQGSALLTTVRVENQGQNKEEDVKVSVSIPQLSLAASDYIDSISKDSQKSTEELYVRIPSCAKPGIYQLIAEASYNSGRGVSRSIQSFEVVGSDACVVPQQQAVTVVPPQQATPPQTTMPQTSTPNVKMALEVVLIVLIGLLVILGIVLSVTKMREQ